MDRQREREKKRERKREREGERDRQREAERERESKIKDYNEDYACKHKQTRINIIQLILVSQIGSFGGIKSQDM